jgi:hypothetical protein
MHIRTLFENQGTSSRRARANGFESQIMRMPRINQCRTRNAQRPLPTSDSLWIKLRQNQRLRPENILTSFALPPSAVPFPFVLSSLRFLLFNSRSPILSVRTNPMIPSKKVLRGAKIRVFPEEIEFCNQKSSSHRAYAPSAIANPMTAKMLRHRVAQITKRKTQEPPSVRAFCAAGASSVAQNRRVARHPGLINMARFCWFLY